ncbi:MAG: peptidase E [Bacillati bacterium ANGP1]|uniref:Peptidase E n=1 Tax=Candidatus Segetimicrobium genomatis TaxID=2569760 RepID=A0A537JYX9_9BACT|nr:MAG: peptidase E [Terrabacteria group bacterium ANGP1]
MASCIVVLGGGGFSTEPENPRLDRYVLSLARRSPPKICFVPTASGDSDNYIVRFYDAFTVDRCLPSHLRLFSRKIQDLREVILDQDIVYVGGGATAYLLATWRLAGLDAVFREAWERGVVLSGVSAGGVCWFEAGLTDTFGRPLRPLRDGLGFLAGSFCPHYDGEKDRRPAYQRAVAEGAVPPGIAADDGVALVYRGAALAEIVSSRPAARAWRVERTAGGARETELVPRFLE